MEVIYERCCGIDVHKNMVMACVICGVRKKEIREFGTMTDDILELVAWLKEKDCYVVAMESTGVYWKPLYNIFELEGMEILVANAQHIKAVPGRKTDVKDAEWIAQLCKHGLIKPSYIPSRIQREQREIVRYRNELVNERARELNRIQSVLEGANIKLTSVITDINGKTGRLILQAIVSGETNSIELSKHAKGSLVNKVAQLQRSLKGTLGEHQITMLRYQVTHIDTLSKLIDELDVDIKKK